MISDSYLKGSRFSIIMYEQQKTLSFIIAGGKGTRLGPLIKEDPKPMISFGGKYRLIDFVMSNLFNSKFEKFFVLTQYNTDSLNRHINGFWSKQFGANGFCEAHSPQETLEGREWYEGTAHAIYQNKKKIEKHNPDNVLVFGADHVYLMDVGDMLKKHNEGPNLNGDPFDLTISALEVSYEDAKGFGVFEVDENNNFLGFEEKPKDPKRIPGKDTCFASMGNYIFRKDPLLESLEKNKDIKGMDFGKHIIPYLMNKNKNNEKILVYNFSKNEVPGINDYSRGYWADVGTIDAYYYASMEMNSEVPRLHIGNEEWAIITDQDNAPAHRNTVNDGIDGVTKQSYAAGGVIVSGGKVYGSILGSRTYIDRGSSLSGVITFDRVYVGKEAKLEKTIISSGVRIPDGMIIGVDYELDKKRGFIPKIKDAPTDIRVITKAHDLEAIMRG